MYGKWKELYEGLCTDVDRNGCAGHGGMAAGVLFPARVIGMDGRGEAMVPAAGLSGAGAGGSPGVELRATFGRIAYLPLAY